MKTAPLTDYEIQFIKWRIWEPLRRNQDYRNEYGKIYKDGDEFKWDDPNPFCEKWDISYPVSPKSDFDQLYGPLDDESTEEAKKRIQGLFIERYVPESDDAAFTTISDCLIKPSNLKVYINLEKSRNQIEGELKKILDEWLTKWVNFYGGKRKRKKDGNAVVDQGVFGKYLEIHINLEAPRTTKKDIIEGFIEPELKSLLSLRISEWSGNKKTTPRHHPEKWSLCFQIYDMVEDGSSYPEISAKLCEKINSIHKRFRRAWRAIYPGEEYPTKRNRKREIALESLKNNCATCNHLTCVKTGKLCPEKEKYADQDSLSSGGIDSIGFEGHINKQVYKEWTDD